MHSYWWVSAAAFPSGCMLIALDMTSVFGVQRPCGMCKLMQSHRLAYRCCDVPCIPRNSIPAVEQELREQQGAIVQQLYELSRSIVSQQQLQMQQQQHAQALQLASVGPMQGVWGAYSALGFVTAGAVAAIGILTLARR